MSVVETDVIDARGLYWRKKRSGFFKVFK